MIFLDDAATVISLSHAYFFPKSSTKFPLKTTSSEIFTGARVFCAPAKTRRISAMEFTNVPLTQIITNARKTGSVIKSLILSLIC